MRQCLTHPEGGYYTRQTTSGKDQFGTKGDFVTSPEISQVFGELVGIWLYAEWLAQGRKEKVQIIEVGPGRGTLMDDVLRVWRFHEPKIREHTNEAPDAIELQSFHEEHRGHLPRRSVTISPKAASKASLGD
jgi:SAM-dependent MidA family methyltransferase